MAAMKRDHNSLTQGAIYQNLVKEAKKIKGVVAKRTYRKRELAPSFVVNDNPLRLNAVGHILRAYENKLVSADNAVAVIKDIVGR